MEEAVSKLEDFVTKKPYVEEAERRVTEYRTDNNLWEPLDDEHFVQLMADYAAEIWQEGYDEGSQEGYDDGYAAKENEFDDD